MNTQYNFNNDYTQEEDFLPVIVPIYAMEGGENMPFDKISCELGIAATDKWQQEHEKLKGIEDIPQSRWTYKFPAKNSIFIQEEIETVLDTFENKRNIILGYVKKRIVKNTYIYLRIYVTNKFPVFELSVELLKRLSHLQVELAFDIFPIEYFENNEKPLKLKLWTIDNDSYNSSYNAWIIDETEKRSGVNNTLAK